MDKVKGMIIGHALADALGAPMKFNNGVLSELIQRYTRNCGLQRSSLGQTTDGNCFVASNSKWIHKGKSSYRVYGMGK